VGPMLPLEEFDASDALKKRFDLLCGAGAAAGAFKQLPAVEFQQTGAQPGQWLKASLTVPKSAPFFADHFPRRPVFPGSLLMQAQLQLAASLAAEIPTPTPGRAWHLRTVLDMKLRTFIPPGESLELEVKLSERSNAHAVLGLEARRGTRTVGSARVLCVADESS
jgi:3-hydroxymyristoyl/3-hydroxydecanoyl-(acyl carrier protein) dehydratase